MVQDQNKNVVHLQQAEAKVITVLFCHGYEKNLTFDAAVLHAGSRFQQRFTTSEEKLAASDASRR